MAGGRLRRSLEDAAEPLLFRVRGGRGERRGTIAELVALAVLGSESKTDWWERQYRMYRSDWTGTEGNSRG